MVVSCKIDSTESVICKNTDFYIIVDWSNPTWLCSALPASTCAHCPGQSQPFSHSVSQVHHHPNQSSAFTGLGQEDKQIDFALPGCTLWWPGDISALRIFPVRNDKKMLSSLQAPLAQREAPKTHGALCNLAVTCGAAEQVCWCQTAHVQLTQLYRYCSPGEQQQLWLHNSILQPSVLTQGACYVWYTCSCWFH